MIKTPTLQRTYAEISHRRCPIVIEDYVTELSIPLVQHGMHLWRIDLLDELDQERDFDITIKNALSRHCYNEDIATVRCYVTGEARSVRDLRRRIRSVLQFAYCRFEDVGTTTWKLIVRVYSPGSFEKCERRAIATMASLGARLEDVTCRLPSDHEHELLDEVWSELFEIDESDWLCGVRAPEFGPADDEIIETTLSLISASRSANEMIMLITQAFTDSYVIVDNIERCLNE